MRLTGKQLYFFFSVTLAMLLHGCLHDIESPFMEAKPQLLRSAILDTIIEYPNTAVCSVTVVNISYQEINSRILYDSAVSIDTWLTCKAIFNTYDKHLWSVFTDSSVLGNVSGCIKFIDPQDSFCELSFSIQRIFKETFSQNVFPNDWWQVYQPVDTSLLRIHRDGKLLIAFEPGDAGVNSVVAGVVSHFNISGNFRVEADFDLRDDMVDGFESGFYMGTSTWPTVFGSHQYGIFLSGMGQAIRVNCRSVDFQSYSQEITYSAGSLAIERRDSSIQYEIKSDAIGAQYTSLISFLCSPSDSLFIHAQLKVADLLKPRHCFWDNIAVKKGTLTRVH